MSGSGLLIQSAFNDGAAPTRYGGIVANTRLFRSTHVHAVSVRSAGRPPHNGVSHSAGQPDHADGRTDERGHAAGSPTATTCTPFGSPGVAAGGPTDAGGLSAGSLAFGITGPEPGINERGNTSPLAVTLST